MAKRRRSEPEWWGNGSSNVATSKTYGSAVARGSPPRTNASLAAASDYAA